VQRTGVYQSLEREDGRGVAKVQFSSMASKNKIWKNTCQADSCQLLRRGGVLMNYEEAKKLLDEVKEGRLHPLHKITLALQLTGDLDFEI
jgi:hypothetical protein